VQKKKKKSMSFQLALSFYHNKTNNQNQCFRLLTKAAKWRYAHCIPVIFQRGYDAPGRIELKKRFLNSFFFGHAADVGDPIYYNCMGQADMDHGDLVPGR
jgi:hypothetical protein